MLFGQISLCGETHLAKFRREKLCFRSASLIVGKIKYVGVTKKFDDRSKFNQIFLILTMYKYSYSCLDMLE